MEDWLHRKAEENAHNEILAFLMIVLGVNLLVGGLLTIIIASEEPNWLLNFPYIPLQASPANLGLVLTFTGFAILSAGFILVIHYNRKRSWYIKEIEKSSIIPKWNVGSKTVDQILEEYTGKKRKKND